MLKALWRCDIFNVQERVVLSGSWIGGCLHLAAVAACNVGDIRLEKEPDLRTNRDRVVLRHLGGDIDIRTFRALAADPFCVRHPSSSSCCSSWCCSSEIRRRKRRQQLQHQQQQLLLVLWQQQQEEDRCLCLPVFSLENLSLWT
ncbi:hypothetical protein ACSSS7_004988 [Eimeria intestinalis]